jgi:hypothetical protein
MDGFVQARSNVATRVIAVARELHGPEHIEPELDGHVPA